MTPYKTSCKAIVHPDAKSLMFGPLEKKYLDDVGTIVDQKYLAPKLSQIYELQFSDGERFWFAENEIRGFNR